MIENTLIKYVNHLGQSIDLSEEPYNWQMTDLFDYGWNFSVTPNSSGRGSKLSRFNRGSVERTIIMDVECNDVVSAMNAMHSIFEVDILSEQPGKLYFGNQYVSCYISASKKPNFITRFLVELELTVQIEYPFWITEEKMSFPVFTDTSDGFVLPMALPMNFSATLDTRQLINDHYTACNAIIVIYGPCTDPEFSIGSHLYKMMNALQTGERYEIDQTQKTVVKIGTAGEKTNAFNLRWKEQSIFEPIPKGENILQYAGAFAIDITLLKERSEPLWS